MFEITEDNENNIWVQTERGISRINIDDYSIRNFDKNDGYPVTKNNYDLNKLSNGNLVFISDYEIVSLDPQNIKDNNVSPKVSFTNLSISGKEIYPYSSDVLDSYIGATDELNFSV
ncbi:MAG: hypothetical protein U5K00_05310 [Melioribacteraceae bacterium]|nr:hypothetical protein [Melioribacteraceae bacterium]